MDNIARAEIESTKEENLKSTHFITRVNFLINSSFKQIASLRRYLLCKVKSLYAHMSKSAKLIVVWAVAATIIGLTVFSVVKTIDEKLVPHVAATSHTSVSRKNKDVDLAVQMQSQNIQQKNNDVLSEKLSQIQKTLDHSSMSTKRLSKIEGQIKALSQAILDMKKSTSAIQSASLNSAHISEKNQIVTNQQVRRVESELAKISHAVTPTHYLPITALPFKVVGLDFWNGKPMASIGMKDMNGVMYYRLMGQGMSFDCNGHCENWTLAKIKTDPNELLFSNQKGQKIKVIV